MGTSKSYGGPRNDTPLVPPWANEPIDGAPSSFSAIPEPGQKLDAPFEDPPSSNDDVDDVPDSSSTLNTPTPWDEPRRLAKAFAHSTSSGSQARGRLRRIARTAVGALGGARTATLGSRAGRRTAGALGAFLSDVGTNGITAAAERRGITAYLGGNVDEFLVGVVAALAPDGALTEDAIANDALIETLAELFDDFALADSGLEALEHLDESTIRQTMERFAENYITGRLMFSLSQRVEAGAINGDRYVTVEDNLRDYVRTTVKLDFGTLDLTHLDWSGPEARQLVDRILVEGYRMLEEAE